MKFIKKLSNRGVNLYIKQKELIVVRNMTKEQLKSILDFYNKSNFDSRPNILEVNHNKNYIVEEYIDGKILEDVNYIESKKVAISISKLSNKIIGNIHLTEYINKQFYKKINSITLEEKYFEIIKGFKTNFLILAKNIQIDLNWTHGDLKGDNILLNKNKEIFFIDWEWIKEGHYIEDIQKFIQTTLKYDKVATDDFINIFFKYKTVNWKLFIYLESFHFFLNQILQLSKNRITLETFKKSVGNKINSMINNKIYNSYNNGKRITVGTNSNLSNILDGKEIKTNKNPEHIMYNNNMNNQEQRLSINKGLMLKYKDFLVLHGITFKLKNNKNILLGGPSGSGKSYIFMYLKKLGLVQEIYDEDLINLDIFGNLKPLGKQTFKGKINGQYIYRNENREKYGKLDIVLYIDNDLCGLKKSSFSNKNIVEYLIHEKILGNLDLIELYKKILLPQKIESYIIGNNKIDSDFSILTKKLGKK